jgi:hypothetical protein
VLITSCKNYHRNSTHTDVPVASIEAGEALAKKYCQSCHLLPDPSLLDTKSWEKGVLPNMGPRLGIFYYGFEMYPSYKNDKSLGSDFYPSKPVLSFNEWQSIIDYYVATSPDSLPGQNRKQSIKDELSLFTVLTPSFHYTNPATSYVKIKAADSLQRLILSDAQKETVYFFNSKLEFSDSIKSNGGPVVDIDFRENKMLACNIGIMNPQNGKFGKGQFISLQESTSLNNAALFDTLQRPVQILSSDLNNDGKMDYVVCEFGNLKGAFSWMQNLGNNQFSRKILRPFPGAIKAYINDYNKDGLADIWVLFSQGEEGIFLYTNKGNGTFREKEVLRFPPVYGSSYFELADFNNDGYPNIVYTCGDNSDYSTILKPYHGVYIYLNDGLNNFKQGFFFPLNGCYKAIARDFDNDGDLDIATISFFADYARQPEEGFVYLENRGNYKFQPFSIAQTQVGRWLTMDAGDLDGDGKIDLVLGNFSVGPTVVKPVNDWTHGPPFIVLQNGGKKFSR